MIKLKNSSHYVQYFEKKWPRLTVFFNKEILEVLLQDLVVMNCVLSFLNDALNVDSPKMPPEGLCSGLVATPTYAVVICAAIKLLESTNI